jgi:hypothetical protein
MVLVVITHHGLLIWARLFKPEYHYIIILIKAFIFITKLKTKILQYYIGTIILQYCNMKNINYFCYHNSKNI